MFRFGVVFVSVSELNLKSALKAHIHSLVFRLLIPLANGNFPLQFCHNFDNINRTHRNMLTKSTDTHTHTRNHKFSFRAI